MDCLRDQFVEGVILDERYRTISPLNHGSFGMVFMAQDLLTDETVAIKCITKKSAPSDAGLDFAVDDKSEELALHSRLKPSHNIVNLIRSFETEAHVYLVLEFCPQGDLYEAIRKGHGPLETEHVRQLMLQLVDAVSFIHSKGVYHRDIKPENIFLAQDGSLKLGDFGLATTDKWSYEVTVGSDRYMAPEQFDSAGDGYSPAAADIWAIGICLLNVLFSRNPFTTPTEADPLFLDFSRDKQSLFDVFPDMSQDTYEVIVQCMNLDPKRRSLIGARDALMRVVSFTTEDESLDEFCGAEHATMASANREPLRTPSIQTHQGDGDGAFPWAKALHASPRHVPKLKAIPDESYSEDIFSKSEESPDWCSAVGQTPTSSVVESSLGASMNLRAAEQTLGVPKVSPMAGSLPINVGKPSMSAMSWAFGRDPDAVSKSWSDLWEEEEEEEEREQRMKAMKQELNSRTWSHESRPEVKKVDQVEPAHATHDIEGDIDDDLVADGFFFHEPVVEEKVMQSTPRYSPPPKRNNYDKWAMLGERRRALNATPGFDKTPESKPRRLQVGGFGYKSYEAGVWDNSTYHGKFLGKEVGKDWGKHRAKECSGNRGRDWNWRRGGRVDLGDVEWVGGW